MPTEGGVGGIPGYEGRLEMWRQQMQLTLQNGKEFEKDKRRWIFICIRTTYTFIWIRKFNKKCIIFHLKRLFKQN